MEDAKRKGEIYKYMNKVMKDDKRKGERRRKAKVGK
jgi:hypothetical protein